VFRTENKQAPQQPQQEEHDEFEKESGGAIENEISKRGGIFVNQDQMMSIAADNSVWI
jgi:hypothetical protein